MTGINFLNQNVSCFSSKNDTRPTDTKTLRGLILGGDFKKQIGRLRDCSDPKQRKELKARLPCFTPSGVFSHRSADGLIQPSGLIAVDLDRKDNGHVDQQLWEDLSSRFNQTDHPNVLYCGRSCSGTGWWMLIPIESYDPAVHKSYFEAITKDLALMGLNADKSGSDVCRLRFVSYDERPFVNEHAMPYSLPSNFKSRDKTPAKGAGLVEDDSAAWGAFQLARYLLVVDQKEINLLDNYEDWRNAAFALLSAFTLERARELYHRFSYYHPEYDRDACDRQFDACLRSQRQGGSGITIATILKLCREKCGALIDFQEFTNN